MWWWIAACAVHEAPSSDAQALVRAHLARYPASTPEDVYKLLHQAVMGPAHAAPARDDAKRWLDDELRTLGEPRPDEPAIEVLDPSTGMARVHLRPWIAAGGDPYVVLDAFLATADAHHGDPEVLDARLRDVIEHVELPFGRAALEALVDRQRAAGFPAIHHSAAYEAAYAPAYRVVWLVWLGPLPPGISRP